MKLKRAAAVILYNAIAKRLPESNTRFSFGARGLRAWCAKQMLEKCGKNVNVERMASFGRGVTLGDHSGIGIGASIGAQVHIGNDVMMGPECTIYTVMHRFDRTDIPMREQGYTPVMPVTIGNDVWIGSRVTIMPGVTISDGCVIGAGAVVTHDIPPYAVAAGVPAKVIRFRNSNEGETQK